MQSRSWPGAVDQPPTPKLHGEAGVTQGVGQAGPGALGLAAANGQVQAGIHVTRCRARPPSSVHVPEPVTRVAFETPCGRADGWQTCPARVQSWAVALVGPASSALWGVKLIWGVPRHPLSSGAQRGSAVSKPGTCGLGPGHLAWAGWKRHRVLHPQPQEAGHARSASRLP